MYWCDGGFCKLLVGEPSPKFQRNIGVKVLGQELLKKVTGSYTQAIEGDNVNSTLGRNLIAIPV